MSRLLLACVFALMSVVGIAGVAAAQEAANEPVVAAQPTTVNPGPTGNAPPQEPSPEVREETKRKLWIGGIAVLLFVLVYYRNKKRWAKWRKERAAKKG